MNIHLDKVINFIAKKFTNTKGSTELVIALANTFLLQPYV